jgi:hypothetical protein
MQRLKNAAAIGPGGYWFATPLLITVAIAAPLRPPTTPVIEEKRKSGRDRS